MDMKFYKYCRGEETKIGKVLCTLGGEDNDFYTGYVDIYLVEDDQFDIISFQQIIDNCEEITNLGNLFPGETEQKLQKIIKEFKDKINEKYQNFLKNRS